MRDRGAWVFTAGAAAIMAFYKGVEWLAKAIASAPFPSPVHLWTLGGLLFLTIIIQIWVGKALIRVPVALIALAACYAMVGVSIHAGSAIGSAISSGRHDIAFLWDAFTMRREASIPGVLFGLIFACLFAYLGVVALLGILFGRLTGRAITGERHLRGRGLISFQEAQKVAEAKDSTSKRRPFFGMLHIPERASNTHFLLVGATGSGKTLSIRMLMESVLPREEVNDTRALIYDAKRDMLSILEGMNLKCPIHIMNPFDSRCVAWDMAKDITSPSAADQVATILIPEEKNSSSPYFSDAARALMSGAIVSLMRSAPGAWEFRDVIYVLKNAERLKSLLSRCEETEDLISQYFSNERTANDVISTVATKIQRYQYIAAAWSKAREKISLIEWAQGSSIILLGNDEMTRSALDAINRVIFKRVTEIVLAQTESRTRRTWFFLDELRQAGKLEGLNSLLTMGRSKGACVVIGFQDIEGISAVYGEREAAEIAGLCANKAILRLDSPHTAKWAASVFGEKEVLEMRASSGTSSGENKSIASTKTISSGQSESWNEQLSKKDVILASQFMDVPPTNFEYGLFGSYLIPEVGAYQVHVGGDWLRNALSKPSESALDFIRRDEADEVLSAWNEADYDRLRLVKVRNPQSLRETVVTMGSAEEKTEGLREGEENFTKLMELFKEEKP